MLPAVKLVLAGLALLLASYVFDTSPLFVPAAAFVLTGALVPLWLWGCARGAGITRWELPARTLEDEPLEVVLELRRTPLGLPGAELIDPLLGEPVPLAGTLSLRSGRSRARVRLTARAGRRGLLHLAPPTLWLGDPFGLAHATRRGRAGHELLVLPRTEPVRWAGGRSKQHRLAGPGSEPLSAADVDGLRPYRRGTPASRIHWPALARSGELLERRVRSESDGRPLVVLDSHGGHETDQLDAAVRAAASLALELARHGGCRVLLPGDRRAVLIDPDLGAWRATHARLALVEPAPPPPGSLLGPGGGWGPLLYVAVRPPERLPPSLGSRPGAQTVLVLPASIPWSGRAGFEVSGCRGYPLSASPAGRRRTAGRADRAA